MEVNHVQGGKEDPSDPAPAADGGGAERSSRRRTPETSSAYSIQVFSPLEIPYAHPGRKFQFEGIPTFAPEHFARVRQMDTMKRKQFIKGISQIAQEGAIQIFQEFNTGMEEIIVGVVGVLQFEVLTYRLENEYNVEVKLEQLPLRIYPLGRESGRGGCGQDPGYLRYEADL